MHSEEKAATEGHGTRYGDPPHTDRRYNLLSRFRRCASVFHTGGMTHTGRPRRGCQTNIWALLAQGGVRAQRGMGTL